MFFQKLIVTSIIGDPLHLLVNAHYVILGGLQLLHCVFIFSNTFEQHGDVDLLQQLCFFDGVGG